MTLYNQGKLGTIYLEVYVDRFSSVDSYVESGYSETLERDLTEEELEWYQDAAQDYAYNNGSSNHN
jgi:hypothetical protein